MRKLRVKRKICVSQSPAFKIISHLLEGGKTMFRKVLIANRGEIAVRIIRACRELGIQTVAVFSEADRGALHAKIADEAFCIGPAATKDSYLNQKAILAVCEVTGAEALHPGFGFLSENAAFARMCQKCGVTFIGPPPEAMECMGDKSNAKLTMKNAGVPVIPGSDGAVTSLSQAKGVAQEAVGAASAWCSMRASWRRR